MGAALRARARETGAPAPAPCRGPWHVDETYIRVDGEWRYLYRAVDGTGQTIDFLLSAKRDKKAAKRFFQRALGRDNTRNPCEIVTDRLKSYPAALRDMKREGELWRFTRHRRGRWLNNLVEQDHRRIKRRTAPMLGFGSFVTARRTLAGVEAMAMLAKRPCSASSLLPGSAGAEHGIEDHDQLAHAGGQRDLGRLPGLAQSFVEAGDGGVGATHGREHGHVQAGAQRRPAALDHAPSAHLAAVAAERGHTDQGRGLAAGERAELGQLGQ